MQSAQRLRKPQSYVSRCEAGRRRVDIFELQEFARVYQKPLTYFVGEIEISAMPIHRNKNGSK